MTEPPPYLPEAIRHTAQHASLYSLPITLGRWLTTNFRSDWQVISRSVRMSAIYRVSQEEWARLREDVPYVKVCWYYPKHLCPKLNDYGGNCPRKVWSSGGSTHCICQLTSFINVCPWVWCPMTQAVSCICASFRGMLQAAVSCIVLRTLRTNMTWRASIL
jgi:hypothetical protein